nr:hypothetical protein OG999_10105 [Streptomyces sp. NBC_00886]
MLTSRALRHVSLGAAVLAVGLIAPATLIGDTADTPAAATVTAVAPSRSGSPQSTTLPTSTVRTPTPSTTPVTDA